MKRNRQVERGILVLILLLALGVRLYGLDFGLPYTIHPDEPNVVDHAVRILKTGDWNPRWYIYPSGYSYLQVGVLTLHLLWGIARGLYTSPADLPDSSHVITGAPASYLWARGTTALFGVLTVLLVYLVGRRVFSEKAGLAGALLLALSPLHVEHSHYATTDVPTAALALLALLLMLDFLKEGNDGRAFLAGLVVGLAGGFKYNAVVALLPLLVAVGMRTLRWGPPEEGVLRPLGRFFGRALGLALLGVVVGYTLACPFTFADLPTFLDDLGYETHIYRFGGEAGVIRVYEVGDRLLPPWQAYAHALWRENAPAALAYLGGTVCLLLRRRKQDLLLLLFTWGYYLFLASYASIFVRNVLVSLPGMTVLGGGALADGVDGLAGRLRRRPAFLEPLLLAGLLLAIVASPTVRLLKADAYRATPPSQRLARQWLDQHVAPGEKVAAELHPLLFVGAPYQVTSVDYLSNYSLEVLSNRGYRYVVANSEHYGPEYAEQDTLPEHYARLLGRLEAVADFAGHTQDLPGPRLTIYRVPERPLSPQVPLDLVAGPGLRLLGADVGRRLGEGDLSYVSASTTFRPGEIIATTLYLRADGPLPEEYTVALWLRSAEGRVVARQEAAPCAGACPTSRWTPGEVVIVQQDLLTSPVLSPGRYRLEVAFLRPGGAPLPGGGGEGGFLLGEVVIQEGSP